MRLIKLQISVGFLKLMGLGDLLSSFQKVEMLNAYQYDRKNFFSVQKITFPTEFIHNKDENEIKNYLRKKFGATDIDILQNVDDNTVVVMMRQKRIKGFWTLIIPTGPWSLNPPLIVDQNSAVLSLVTTESFYMGKLKTALRPYGRFIKVLANTVIEDYDSVLNAQPFPTFTERQKELALYAVRRGYYESPRKVKAEEIANHFNISVSTLNEHLRKIERTSMNYLFGEKEK